LIDIQMICIFNARFWIIVFVIAFGARMASFAAPQPPGLKLAVAVSLTGPGDFYGLPLLDGARLAVEEANAQTDAPHIDLSVYDDHSTDEGAIRAAQQADADNTVVTVGPALTSASLAAGLTYAEAGLASIVSTAHGDGVIGNETTFRSVFSTSEMGKSFANYLYHILNGRRAIVIFRDNGFGRPIAKGFKAEAEGLGITTSYLSFTTPAERETVAEQAAADPGKPAIILGILSDDAKPLMLTLRRRGAEGPFLGPSAIAGESFAKLFVDQPEEKETRGFFTNGLFTASPVMLDSAGAETLAFSNRFRARYGHDPGWVAIQGYDATRLAIKAVRTAASQGASDTGTIREAVVSYLAARNSPTSAFPGLTGPLWFTPEHGRELAIRVGRFHDGLFESAPLQLMPVPNPDPAEITSGVLIPLGEGRYMRRQQVVYTGVYLNELARVDVAQSSFTADFYLWVRYVRGAETGADPTDIEFPDLVRGKFDGAKPVAQRDLGDGTTYRLWHMRGDFKNDFDLRLYPADQQTLTVRFFNARASSHRLVYVVDQRSSDSGLVPAQASSKKARLDDMINASAKDTALVPSNEAANNFHTAAAANAFRNLTQWEPLRTSELRDTLVTDSALGDPQLVGLERVRELSGFNLSVDLRRRMVAILMKTLLPLGLMTLIMYASLNFPAALVKEKVTVAITAALSGAVLLSAINAQLGNVGYVIAVEYGFYVFFALCLLCIVGVLTAERFRVSGQQSAAVLVERSARYLFLLGCAGTLFAAWYFFARR
jgi:ABC-type branched-subunit amino acid transport system substrate-binding protein